MTAEITRESIEQKKGELLDGLQFARHRLKEFQLRAAMGGDEQPMLDEMAKIERIEAKLAGLGYGIAVAEECERAAQAAARAEERRAKIAQLRSDMDLHAAAMAEVAKAVAKLLPIGAEITRLAKSIDGVAAELFPGATAFEIGLNSQADKFLRAVGAWPDGGKAEIAIIELRDLAERVAADRGGALEKVAALETEAG